MRPWRILLFAFLHFSASGACLFIVLMGSDFDEGIESRFARVGEALFWVLAQPGLALWNRIGTGQHDIVEWTLVGANSLLWGCALSWCWGHFVARDRAGDAAEN